jgi:hypothetical protein
MAWRFRGLGVMGWLVRLLFLAALWYLDERFHTWFTEVLLIFASVSIVFRLLNLGRDNPTPAPGDFQVVLRAAGRKNVSVFMLVSDWEGRHGTTSYKDLSRPPIDVGPRIALADAETFRSRLVSLGATADIEQR